MRILPVLFLLGAALTAVPAYAQWGWGWGPRRGASTAGESFQRGFADVVRSAGAANLMNSQAMKNVEDARRKYIDNRLQATQTYFEMKRYNQEYRDATKQPRPTSEQLFRLAKEATPGQLSPADLDPVTGEISWPDVLKLDMYAEERAALNDLFAERANAGGNIGFEQRQAIRQNVARMQADLAGQINDIPPQVFSSANAFLRKLEFTASVAG